MRILKKLFNYFITYLLRPLTYRLFFIPRYELFKKPPYYFRYYGFKVFYKPKDGLVYHVGSTGSFESDVIACCLKDISDDATVVDIGANIGLITLPLVKLLPKA